MPAYEVICGNIGQVYSGGNYQNALDAFTIYQRRSINGEGRAAGEDVYMMRDGELHREFTGGNAMEAQAKEAAAEQEEVQQ